MIAKKYRLKEREVKKVLQKGKPFFSYSLVFNILPNTLSHGRFAIVISGKSVENAVIRNIYRRMFYDVCAHSLEKNIGDIVCVVKVKTQLKKETQDICVIQNELFYLFDKKLGKNT